MSTVCHYCGGEATTSDHIVPRALGGADAQYNRVPACLACNQEKADRMPICQCRTCRIAINMPRRKPKTAGRKKVQDIHTLSGYLRYPAMPDDLR